MRWAGMVYSFELVPVKAKLPSGTVQESIAEGSPDASA